MLKGNSLVYLNAKLISEILEEKYHYYGSFLKVLDTHLKFFQLPSILDGNGLVLLIGSF